jgi:phosphonate transport system substrate-binding protein
MHPVYQVLTCVRRRGGFVRTLTTTRLLRAAAVALLAVAVAGCSSSSSSSSSSSNTANTTGNTVHPGWPTTLVFGSVGAENATSLLQSLAPIQDVLKAKLGIHLKVVIGTSYASLIEAQVAGKAQLIEYGPFSYWIAEKETKIQNVGVVISAPNTTGAYYSVGVVNPKLNPGITSIKDFAGKKTCYSDPASTSGYLYPSYGLLSVGINPNTGVTPVFAGSDTTAPLDVAKGSCQVGFSNNLDLPLIFTQNHIPQSDIKIVWTSQAIPGSPVAASDSLPASLRNALESVFVTYANSTYEAAHGYCSSVTACDTITGQWGFAPPSVANYDAITQICALTKSPSCKA